MKTLGLEGSSIVAANSPNGSGLGVTGLGEIDWSGAKKKWVGGTGGKIGGFQDEMVDADGIREDSS